jgi:Oligopeptidase F
MRQVAVLMYAAASMRGTCAFFAMSRLAAAAASNAGSSTARRSSRLLATAVEGAVKPAAAVGAVSGPAWDLADAYPALQSELVNQDLSKAESLIEELKSKQFTADSSNGALSVQALSEAAEVRRDASVLVRNLATFANCELSCDGKSSEARALLAQARNLGSALAQAADPLALALRLAPADVAEQYLELQPSERFAVQHDRKLRDYTLSLSEEQLAKALAIDGHSSWGTLYSSISSSLVVDVSGTKMGASQVSARTIAHLNAVVLQMIHATTDCQYQRCIIAQYTHLHVHRLRACVLTLLMIATFANYCV